MKFTSEKPDAPALAGYAQFDQALATLPESERDLPTFTVGSHAYQYKPFSGFTAIYHVNGTAPFLMAPAGCDPSALPYIVAAWLQGREFGELVGANQARLDIRNAMGISSHSPSIQL